MILLPNFTSGFATRLASIPTIGKKSRPELIAFFDQTKEFLRQFPDEESVSAQVKHHLIASPSALGLPDYAMDSLHEMESALGHFPLFAAIQLYIENRLDEERAIIEGCLDIYEGQDIPERTEVAAALNLSPERVRQKRNKLIERLPAYFKTYANLGFVTNNPYRWQMTHVEEDINASEGTNFKLNFVCWVLGNVFDELTLIGDSVKSIGGYFELYPFLCIVPTALVSIFDFDAFLQDLDDRMKEKRINEQKVSLRSIISSHLTVQYCDNELPEIDTTCRTILYLHYPVEVDQGYVIFPANAYKKNTIIVEEILRAAGHPLTLAEITEEYMYLYPERDSTESSLRGAINTNENIVPVSRSSTYALAEWNLTTNRGGTIRQFVLECIEAKPERISTTAEIAEYVMQFRPETNEMNIVTNISLDPDKTLSFYYKDGIRYLGFPDYDYPEEYFPLESDFRTAIANSTYYPKLLEFIKTYHHFPFSTGTLPEEPNLRSFWIRQEKNYRRGLLDAHALQYYEKIVSEYGHLKIEKKEFEWMVPFAHAAAKNGMILPEEEHFLLTDTNEDLSNWISVNLNDYTYRQKYMPEYRVEKMRRFAERMMSGELTNPLTEQKGDLNVQDNLG